MANSTYTFIESADVDSLMLIYGQIYDRWLDYDVYNPQNYFIQLNKIKQYYNSIKSFVFGYIINCVSCMHIGFSLYKINQVKTNMSTLFSINFEKVDTFPQENESSELKMKFIRYVKILELLLTMQIAKILKYLIPKSLALMSMLSMYCFIFIYSSYWFIYCSVLFGLVSFIAYAVLADVIICEYMNKELWDYATGVYQMMKKIRKDE
jgi:hypothetical protein